MAKVPPKKSAASLPISSISRGGKNNVNVFRTRRSSEEILALFITVLCGGWAVYYYQYQNLPAALTLEQAGSTGFSEYEALKHVRNLTQWGPHSVGSTELDNAIKYVESVALDIKESAKGSVGVRVDVDLFHSASGANLMGGGVFDGKTPAYSDLKHVLLRIAPKSSSANSNGLSDSSILISAHIDSVFAAEGAGDDSSSVATMLELARGLSQTTADLKNGVVFLFNTGEEEGLMGSHAFITQHPWRKEIKLAVDLEAVGLGGKSGIFQAGPNPWAIENFAKVAKYPSGQITSQDFFSSGFLNSATDFQVYKEVGGLSGLDFAYTEKTAVHHTKGEYMITFRQGKADMIYNLAILLSLLLCIALVMIGGYSAATSLALSFLGVILMWICSIGFASIVAFCLPLVVSSSPVPYFSSPWLAAGLFVAPALFGAFVGQHIGYRLLVAYLSRTFSGRKDPYTSLQVGMAELDAERWLFKGGLLQWLLVLIAGNYLKIGSTYLALAWLIFPAIAYGLFEATWSLETLPSPLNTQSLLVGMFAPVVLTAGVVIQLAATVIGFSVRLVGNPGASPDWIGTIIVAILMAAIVCLTMVYLLSYVHISGAKLSLIAATGILFAISLGVVWAGVVPPFTEDTSRAVNIVHVVETKGEQSRRSEPISYLSMISTTPGNLDKEAYLIGEGFICGRDRYIDFVTFQVNYSCWTDKNAYLGWNQSDIPTITVQKDIVKRGIRNTQVLLDTRVSTRWVLKINMREIEDFQWKEANSSNDLIPRGEKSVLDGWHTIQFAGGVDSSKKFKLSLFWFKNGPQTSSDDPLLKLRTDVERNTPITQTVLDKLPVWCTLYGKSTSPHTLSFLTSLPVVK
ncbi:uncharacterized protein LOC127244779 isoform X2 [Andrographis paniculata]|uniref:uncharacterized protein LOC127244779 isoform X2 n=1 Tax=Andrographis paniculata TaxID=175694 RepID=UPI0021E7DA6F|nr:uncharacterized protein LOC127244779 isoform X2 [Andrographis paniculata]